MKSYLEEKLYKKYPKIFRQRNLSITDTAMCFGIECGDGWYDLIDILCFLLQNSVKNNHPQVEAVQVKEKFGGLRFYADNCDEYQEGLIKFAEYFSNKICEFCGTTKNVGTTKNYIFTICKECYKKEKLNNLEFINSEKT